MNEPENACPVLASFCSVLSYRMTEKEIDLLTNTKDPVKEPIRAHNLVLESIRSIAPAILAQYGRSKEIEILKPIPQGAWTKDHISAIETAGRNSNLYIIRNTLANVANGISAIIQPIGMDVDAAGAAAYVAVNHPAGVKKGILALKKTCAL